MSKMYLILYKPIPIDIWYGFKKFLYIQFKQFVIFNKQIWKSKLFEEKAKTLPISGKSSCSKHISK